MASGFFAVLDDIAALMDDVALATKVATRKTAGILGDDLAVNAEKATGFVSNRELPVLWAITKGSLLNKLIIVPIALLLNAFFPVLITYILILGGCYLAYEGAEKVIEYFMEVVLKKKHESHETEDVGLTENNEKEKVKSAITTDFILSVEIVIIALGAVSTEKSMIQIVTVAAVAVLATVGVYGIVALIVRMDDMGRALISRSKPDGILSKIGEMLIRALPVIIRILAVVGTIALLLVAGGIFTHNVHFLHDFLPNVPAIVKEFGIGLVVGTAVAGVLFVVNAVIRVFTKSKN